MKKALLLALMFSVTSASAASMLTSTDKMFVPKAAMGNNFELMAAKLALSMGKSAQVKSYATMMITDHTKLGASVKAATMKADPSMMPPAGVSAAQQKMLDGLKMAGANFDSMYQADMVMSHAETYKLFQTYTQSMNANAGLKTVIKGALPTVKMHWDDAKKLPKM